MLYRSRVSTPGRRLYGTGHGEEVWQANLEAIRKCIKEADIDPEDIQSIGITAYGNGLVFVDENIKPVYPVIVSTDGPGGRPGAGIQSQRNRTQTLPAHQADPLVSTTGRIAAMV